MENQNKFKIFKKEIKLDTYILISKIKDYDLIDQLVKNVKEGIKISTVSRKTNVKGAHTEFNYLNSNPIFFKFLKLIHPYIQEIYSENFTIKEVWGNIFKNDNDYADMHNHDNGAFCGILYCTDAPGPGTYFKEYDLTISEEKGKFVLFHPKLFHEVKPYNYKKERITIAWNFGKVKNWEKYNFINK